MCALSLSPKARTGSLIRHSAGNPFFYPPHHHPNITEFLLIQEGGGRFTIGDSTYEADEGMLLCYPAGVWHEERSRDNKPFAALSFAGIDFRIGSLPANHAASADGSYAFKLGDRRDNVERIAAALIAEVNGESVDGQIAADHWFALLLVELKRLLGAERLDPMPPGNLAVLRAKHYIERNYQENISLELLGRVSHLSPAYLCSLFARDVGESPIQYLIRQRMTAAQFYLRTTSLPVYEVAERVGYVSETHFSSKFHSLFGFTPTQYRVDAKEAAPSAK